MRFTVYRTSNRHETSHVEIEDMQALLDWVKAVGQQVVLTVEEGIAPSVEIYDDYRE